MEGNVDAQNQKELLQGALNLLQSALVLLDQAVAPMQIGAYVDLAINQLASEISTTSGGGEVIPISRGVKRA